MKIRTYTELSQIKTFLERYNYLKLSGSVGASTFGYDRYMNQMLYTSREWQLTRNRVIARDLGCDLGMEGYDLRRMIIVHHMTPLTPEDIERGESHIFDPEFLISVSSRTHSAIHFSNEGLLPQEPIIRTKNDTCPWRV